MPSNDDQGNFDACLLGLIDVINSTTPSEARVLLEALPNFTHLVAPNQFANFELLALDVFGCVALRHGADELIWQLLLDG